LTTLERVVPSAVIFEPRVSLLPIENSAHFDLGSLAKAKANSSYHPIIGRSFLYSESTALSSPSTSSSLNKGSMKKWAKISKHYSNPSLALEK